MSNIHTTCEHALTSSALAIALGAAAGLVVYIAAEAMRRRWARRASLAFYVRPRRWV